MKLVFSGASIFDGLRLHENCALTVENGSVTGIGPVPPTPDVVLPGGILTPAFVDLQVNGGGGIMVDGEADAGRLAAICASHILQGCAGVLPSLITDTPAATRHVIDAAIAAAQANVPGFLGLHLEGPHLDPRRAGAHDAALIRPMAAEDLEILCDAAGRLPVLMVTLAPEAVSPGQITALTRAGVLVSLGHSECSMAEARAAIAAGAACATHLFNTMGPMTGREPGLAGALLDSALPAGLIADGLHVAPAMLRIAMAARPDGLFLVSAATCFAGTDLSEFTMGGRRAERHAGRISLPDGTLAGSDLRLDRAISVMVRHAGIAPERALAMATSVPAALIGVGHRLGHLKPGRRADMVHLDKDLALSGIWWGGMAL
ncbi:N-acetylglucosamine-6-phosphate deacetylase [Szabonella alba]|uniref:N-acetylglucosamine-6-phosphate deacetylase n=1 Tax=Szabonella alba TaxID=2804194 RepID=A0A8K0VAR7_9RHOB|nr:N-acetylglucosamine-6-phosphate deacetylase [Szabonella alba]MBL4915715.1 N-acetylglucosamine-6-phosphate deacetylase [Szabonella alba]